MSVTTSLVTLCLFFFFLKSRFWMCEKENDVYSLQNVKKWSVCVPVCEHLNFSPQSLVFVIYVCEWCVCVRARMQHDVNTEVKGQLLRQVSLKKMSFWIWIILLNIIDSSSIFPPPPSPSLSLSLHLWLASAYSVAKSDLELQIPLPPLHKC